ncbi:MAG TPA: phosphodiester glycosidase family protein [Ktedonosporobacter sp.]|nr:phosphodiester glycosidase family protein [Ktedonosporobacter sp.]
MPIKSIKSALLLLILLIGSLLACDAVPNVTYHGTPIVAQSTPSTASDANGLPLNTWSQASAGIELRYEHWKSPGNTEDTVTIVRLDPHRIHLSVGYQPGQPLLTSEWMKQTGALAIINGGYFDDHNRATGLVIADGHAYSQSYNAFGGMLSVDTQGHIQLRALHQQPYDPDTEQLQQVTQSSPMLIEDGQRTQFNANAASQRRSVVAMDKQGHLLLIASPNAAFSLDELADLLANSDLSLQIALNLDGGASTSLYLQAGNQKVTIDPLTPLPIVIIIK